MSDLIERLRHNGWMHDTKAIRHEAADEIDRLREVERVLTRANLFLADANEAVNLDNSQLRGLLREAREPAELYHYTEYRDLLKRIDATLGTTVQPAAARPVCPGCNQEIDPDCCYCGDGPGAHKGAWGHSYVPMGCNCHGLTDKSPAAVPADREDV